MNNTFRLDNVWKIFLVFIVLAVAAAKIYAAGETAPLRVGVTPTFPPVIYKEAGKLVGVEVDFAKALGAELGRPIQFVELDWEDQIPALTEGRTDIIMSSMSNTKARQIRIAFARPYMAVGQSVLVRREDANKYLLGFPARPDGTIGVLKSTTGDFMVQQEFSRNKRKDFKTPQEAAKALQRKKINLFVCDSPVILWLAGMNEAEGLAAVPIFLTEEHLAWGVRKSDAELLQSVNNAIEKFQKDGRGAAIVKRWIPLFK